MLTIEQSSANCAASRLAMKNAVNAGKTAITANLVDEALHSIKFKCPHGIAKLVEYLDEQGLYKELKAVKKFALDFTGVSLKGENPCIDDKRHDAAQTICEPELERLQELGIIGWYEQATGTGKDDTAKVKDTPAQKAAKKQAKALETITAAAKDLENPDHIILNMVLEYKTALEKAHAYNPSATVDMHNATVGKLASAMMNSINNLQPTTVVETAPVVTQDAA